MPRSAHSRRHSSLLGAVVFAPGKHVSLVLCSLLLSACPDPETSPAAETPTLQANATTPVSAPGAATAPANTDEQAKTWTSPTGEAVPETLEACHAALDKTLSADDKRKMADGTEQDMVNFHFGLGTQLRNNWGLWGGSRLAKSLQKQGLTHPDDMSSIILGSYWCHLQGRKYDISAHVAYYKKYWQQMRQAQHAAEQSGSTTLKTPELTRPGAMCP